MAISARSLALGSGFVISLALAAWFGLSLGRQTSQGRSAPPQAGPSSSAPAATRIAQPQARIEPRAQGVDPSDDDIAVLNPAHRPLFYVVVASAPGGDGIPAARQRQLQSCLGVPPHYLHSGFFRGLAPDVSVALFGGYSSARAQEVLVWARKCVGDAYVKQATWIGD